MRMTLQKIMSLQIACSYATMVNKKFTFFGWLGRAMVLGSFQCQGVLLLWHTVGQGPAVLAAGAGWVGYVLFIFINLVYPIFRF